MIGSKYYKVVYTFGFTLFCIFQAVVLLKLVGQWRQYCRRGKDAYPIIYGFFPISIRSRDDRICTKKNNFLWLIFLVSITVPLLGTSKLSWSAPRDELAIKITELFGALSMLETALEGSGNFDKTQTEPSKIASTLRKLEEKLKNLEQDLSEADRNRRTNQLRVEAIQQKLNALQKRLKSSETRSN